MKLFAFVVGSVAALLYQRTLSFGTINYDDNWLIKNNSLLQTLSLENVWQVFGDLSTATRLRLGSEYLPIRDVSVMADFAVFGDTYQGHHLTQIFLYGLTCALLTVVVARWFDRPRLAWVAGLLFAAHPVHAETVAWLSERKGVLAGVFVALAFVSVEAFIRKPRWRTGMAICALLVLAMWSKALAIAACPLILLRLAYASRILVARKPFVVLAGFAIISAVLAFIPIWITGQRTHIVAPFHGGSYPAHLWLLVQAHGLYLQHAVGIGPFAIQYPLTAEQTSWPLAITGIVSIGAILGTLGWGIRTRRWSLVLWAALWWAAFLAPVSQLFLPLQNIVADRYLYLPSLAATVLLSALINRIASRRIATVASVAAVLCFAVATTAQIPAWSSSAALQRQAIRVHPRNVDAMIALSTQASERGTLKAAWVWLERAARVEPRSGRILLHQGLLLERIGESDQAMAYFRRAIEIDPSLDKARANLALMLMHRGEREEALKQARLAVQTQAASAHNQRTLGVVALSLDKTDEALRAFRAAWELAPDDAENWHNVGLGLAAQGKNDQARYWLNEALKRDPTLQRTQALLKQLESPR